MAKLPALVDALTAIDGRPRGAIDHVARAIREAGLIQTTKRGRGASDMTATDAAYLLIGLYGSDQPAHAAKAATEFGNALRLPFFPGVDTLPDAEVDTLRRAESLVDAVAALIELGGRLRPGSLISRPGTEAGVDVLERSETSGYAALFTLEREGAISTATLAMPASTGFRVLERHFVVTKNTKPFEAPPVEVTVKLNTDVFIALHRALFPPA